MLENKPMGNQALHILIHRQTMEKIQESNVQQKTTLSTAMANKKLSYEQNVLLFL